MKALYLILVCGQLSAATVDVKTLVKRIDELFRSKNSEARMEMEIQTPNWKRTLKMKMWTEGLNKTFVTIEYPKKDKGISTLRMGREMWNYFPKINKVVKVPPSMMMGSWMGSDFTNDDLVKESTLLDDYEIALGPETDPKYYAVVLTAKKQTVTLWGKIEIKIDKASLLPSEQSYYDEKGRKVRIMYFKEVRDFDGKKMPAVLELVPVKKKNKKNSDAISRGQI